nr:transposase, MuDR, MULE transposase domain protein [Tanacetum cinerariifolium]
NACKAYTTEDFDKAISELRGHKPKEVRKHKEAGIEKWSRAYCLRSRYNYMTSNSVKSINSLARIVRRVPITMLVEYRRDLLQSQPRGANPYAQILLPTPTREEHLSKEARMDEERLRHGRVGTNLLAVGMDGNNQILPLATCVSQDRHAVIIQACGTIFDNSFHGFCDRHLMMNCKLKGKKLRGIFWKACKAYTTEDFDKAISELRGHKPKVVRKHKEAGIEKWSRAYCLRSRYNYMTSNNVKSINSLARIVRRVAITMLVEYRRDLLQSQPIGANPYAQILLPTPTREEHLSKEARMDEERLRHGRVYID